MRVEFTGTATVELDIDPAEFTGLTVDEIAEDLRGMAWSQGRTLWWAEDAAKAIYAAAR